MENDETIYEDSIISIDLIAEPAFSGLNIAASNSAHELKLEMNSRQLGFIDVKHLDTEKIAETAKVYLDSQVRERKLSEAARLMEGVFSHEGDDSKPMIRVRALREAVSEVAQNQVEQMNDLFADGLEAALKSSLLAEYPDVFDA